MRTENSTWAGLVAATKGAEIDEQCPRLLRWSIVAPVELHDFPEVLRKFRTVLNSAESAWPGILEQLEISPWPIALLKLEDEANKFIWPHISEQYRYTERGGVTTGIRSRNAIYAALLALAEKDSEYTNSCRLLMAHAFFAHLRILRIPNGTKLEGGLIKGDTSVEAYESYAGREPWPAMTVSPKHIGLAFRRLFSGEDWALSMMQQFPLNQPPDTFAKCEGFAIQLDQLGNGQTKEKLGETRDCVLRYLAQAYGIKPRHRGHGSIAKKTKELSTPPSGNNPPSADADSQSRTSAIQGLPEVASGGETVAPPQANAGIDDDSIRFDACPDEDDEEYGDSEDANDDTDDSTQNQEKDNPRKAHPRQVSAGRRRGSAAGAGTDQAIRASKFFACDKDRLTSFELVSLDVDARRRFAAVMAELVESRREDYSEREPVWSEQHQALIIEAEVILFALIMLWTASSIERTKDLLLIGSSQYEGDNLLVIQRNPDHGNDDMIRLHTEWPPDAPRREPIPLDRVRTPDVRLEDSAGVGRMLRQFGVTVHGVESGLGTEQVFKRPVEFYTDGVTELLAFLDPTGRLTLGRLESYLYEELMSWSKDASATTIITGDFRPSARVQMFYADRLEKNMQNIYAGTVIYARNAINIAAMPRGSAAQAVAHLDCLAELVRKPELRVPFVAAPLGAVHIGINVCPTEIAMRDAVQRLREALLEAASQPTDWNEYFNLYSFFSVWYFGFVTGSRPIECPYLWLHEVNKVNHTARYQDKGEGKARLVWIPEGLLSQMEYYESFLHRTRLGRLTEFPCWLVDEQGLPLVVKPSTLERHLQRFLPGYPSNIARRWMMNTLLDSGCRVVPEWSGHARTGNQLTGRSGTASPHQVGSELLRHLNPIIDFLGLQPIKGKIARSTITNR
jgi:hypothetical protein